MSTAVNLTEGGTTTGVTTINTASISPASNDLILLSITSFDSADNLTSVNPTISGGGMTTWASVATNLFDSTAADYSKLWVFRSQQVTPGSGAITINFGAVNVTRYSWSVDAFPDAIVGNNGADAILQSSATTVGASGTLTLTATLAAFANSESISFGAFGVQASNPIVFTVGSGYTELGKFDTSSQYGMILTEYKNADDDPDASWTATSVFKSGVIAIEVGCTSSAVPNLPRKRRSARAASRFLTFRP